MSELTRREAVGLVVGAAAAGVGRLSAQTPGDFSTFSTATQMLEALRAKRISAVELYDLHVERIRRFNPKLNAIIVETFERGRREAAAADRRLAAGERAPLLGLPMTLKESEQVAGLPQTAGIEPLREYRPGSDGRIAASVLRAGAALLGKTNIPVGLADWQAINPIYGRTNNPWDLTRTPGGSTGGGSAALAAGLTPLEIGSDIGGSIRVPAAFTGVYGHRPSENAVPRSGAFPGADMPNPSNIMGVQGPLARSAFDLELALDVIAGPDTGDDVAWRLELPRARHERLRDFRVAFLPSLPWVAVQPEVRASTAALADWLRSKGVRVGEASPAFDWQAHFADYLRLLFAQTSRSQSAEQREADAARLRSLGTPIELAMADGLTLDYAALASLLDRRALFQRAWAAFFRDWDVLITPSFSTTAFPHRPQEVQTVVIDGREVPGLVQVFYPQVAILCGLPATAFPAGFDADGLPIGLQAVGPYLEDRTPLRFAQLLEREWRAFTPPPGYT
ncbi:MAG: amidase [Pseudomonadota bacterium]